MTIGIYKMEFQDGSVYIGQSNNCERRRGEHYESMLAHLHPNKKVRAAFVRCGSPEWDVVHECSLEELNDAEILCIKQFNSFHGELGLNLNRGGGVVRTSKKVRITVNPVLEKQNAVLAAQTASARAKNKKLDRALVFYLCVGFLAIIVSFLSTM